MTFPVLSYYILAADRWYYSSLHLQPKVTSRKMPSGDSDTPTLKEVELDNKLRKLVSVNSQKGEFGFGAPIVWLNVFLIVLVHVLGVWGFLIAPWTMWKTFVFFSTLVLFGGLGVTAGAHRLWAHKTYKGTLPFRIMMMLFNCIALQNDIYIWVRDHRVHHKFTETDADPHNAKRGFFFAHVGWLMMKKHPDVLLKGHTVDMTDVENDPVVKFQRSVYIPLSLVVSAILPTIIPWYFWGENALYSFLLCVAFRYMYTLNCTWLVNSAAHIWGAKTYDKSINPSENLLVSFFAIGEGYHNYHHTFPYDYSTSEWGPSFNLTTCFIDLCAFLGLVYDRKQVSSAAVERVRRRVGDLSQQ